MTIPEQSQKLLKLIGDRRLDMNQLIEEGAGILINGDREVLRHRLARMVDAGLLRKVKLVAKRRPVGARQFGVSACQFAYERVKAAT